MSDERYTENYGSAGKKPRRNLFLWLFDLVVTLLTIVVAVTMVLTYIAPYVQPSEVWFFPLLGLAAPGTYVITVVLGLYWLIRWRLIRAGVLLALVAVGFFKISLFYKPEFRRTYGEENYDRRSFKVMTYNVRSFFGETGGSSVNDVVRLIGENDPDIICFQEFSAALAEKSDEYGPFIGAYQNAGFGKAENPDSPSNGTLVILSKYRVLRSGVALTPDTSVWADLLIGDDTVRIINNHLHTTAIKTEDNEYITQHNFLSDTAREVKLRSMFGRFRENSVLRAEQVDSIADFIDRSRRLRIVCGDFNDTPVSYAYRQMADGMNDAFRKCGSGYSHTFRGFFNLLRIDYVLSSEALDPISYEVPQVTYSDHLPVFVRLQKNNKN